MLSHQEIGEKMNLFMIHPYTVGSLFLLPNGTKIWRALEKHFQKQYKNKQYQEVMTPQLASVKLWKQSGHWEHYEKNLFSIKHNCCHHQEIDNGDNSKANNHEENQNDQLVLKPMSCPLHCLIFKHTSRSYRDLPIRLADFSALHRNELTGALRGMFRLRKFSQDDAHIFCKYDQIMDEIKGCIEFLKESYDLFGFTYRINLSTRPDKFMGNVEIWSMAEKALKDALELCKMPYTLNEKDGAFYGPKIDVMVKDSLNREHQCGTIQLDFQLAERFELEYSGYGDIKVRPVIIHRAILGSIERMMGILIEHFQGKFPLWLSPRQIAIVPVKTNSAIMAYCENIKNKILLLNNDIDCITVFDSDDTFNYRIKEAEIQMFNYVIIVGEKEMNNNVMMFRIMNHQRNDIQMNIEEGCNHIANSYFLLK